MGFKKLQAACGQYSAHSFPSHFIDLRITAAATGVEIAGICMGPIYNSLMSKLIIFGGKRASILHELGAGS
jgi:hypothetical protein